MSLTRALSNAYSGLATAGRRADIAANNIANANTPGYVRRSANLSQLSAAGFANGVNIAGIDREQNFAVTRQRRSAEASLARSEVTANVYNQLTNALGEPDDEYGLFAALGNLESQISELAVSPDSTALLNGVLGAGYDLTGQFSDLSILARDIRTDADARIANEVDDFNHKLNQVLELNNDISVLRARSDDYAVLEDERQRLIDSMNEIVPMRMTMNDNGWAELMTESGVYLLSHSVHELEFERGGLITGDASYLDGTGQISGLFVGDQELTSGSDSVYAVSGGSIAGHFAVRDDIGLEFSRQLDNLALELIDRFSSPLIDPTLLAGQPGLFTDNGIAPDPADIAGLAQRLSLNPAVDPRQGGQISRLRDGINSAGGENIGNSEILNNLVTALTESRAAPAATGFSGQLSMAELTAEFMSDVGAKRVRHDAIALSAYSRADLLYQAEISTSGVDTDKEMQSLLLIEQAYAANARVIETVNTMLEQLLRI